MLNTLGEGLVLGLSTGTICLLTCTPVYLPYLISEERSLRKSTLKMLEISAGRLIAYIIFGAFAGWLGSLLPAAWRTLLTGIAFILLSTMLILNVLRIYRTEKSCHVAGILKLTRSAFILGILTGVNVCPSFLIALTKSIELGGAVNGMMLFTGFFLGTSVFILPLAFTGLLTMVNWVKLAARYASLLVAIWFIWQGVLNIHKYNHERHTVILNPLDCTLSLVIYAREQDKAYVQELADSLNTECKRNTPIHIVPSLPVKEVRALPDSMVVYVTAPLWKLEYEKQLTRQNYVVLNDTLTVSRTLHFLRDYSFKVNLGTGFHWSFVRR